MKEYAELRRALQAAKLVVSLKPDALEPDPPLLIDGFSLRLHRSDGDALDYLDRISVNAALHDAFETTTMGSVALRVANWDDAEAQARKYDAVAVFGDHLFHGWRSSMSLSAYYPDLAPGGPYTSYGAYRHQMQMDGGNHDALRVISFIGADAYESLERAARADAKSRLGSFGEMAFERRADDIHAMSIIDPVNVVKDAAFAAHRAPAALSHHDTDGERLACPYCRRMFPRHELAIVMRREDAGRRWGVSWGCSDCTGHGTGNTITLERMPDVESGMRWTVHMLSKTWMLHPIAVAEWISSLRGIFGDDLRLWREVKL